MGQKVVIVGGVAGGASAAARLRRVDEEAEIILFEKGPYISYANCGLPYYLGGVIQERAKLLVQTPEAMRARFRIDLRVNSEVTHLDRERKRVEVRELDSGRVYFETYDKLVLAPGAEPVRPRFNGLEENQARIFTLRNIPDTDRIKAFLEEKRPRRAVVVGGGFIGLEMAENLHHVGLEVALVEMVDQVLVSLDREMAALIHHHLRSKGVSLYLGDGVQGFGAGAVGVEAPLTVVLQSGRRLPTDMVILAIGVQPDTHLAEAAGLELGPRGGIRVNKYLQTSDPDIYAVGDAIEVTDWVTGEETLIPLAGPANRQGRIVADNLAGRRAVYRGTQGTSIVKVFDLVAASVGKNEKSLQKLGLPYRTCIVHPLSHAGYYPGGIPLTIKLLFGAEDGKILGAQVVGYEGVDKRIDVLATAMRSGMTAPQLAELELAYAPPFSSAKDPVNMAGFVAQNILNGDMETVSWAEVARSEKRGEAETEPLLLDVREPAEYELGHIAGSVNIPLHTLRTRLEELPREREIIIYCQVGLRAYLGLRILKQHGFTRVRNLSGGYKTYQAVQADLVAAPGISAAAQTGAGNSSSSLPLAVGPTSGPNEAGAASKQEEGQFLGETVVLDACGLQCPGPIMQVYQKMKELKPGDILEVHATDPGFLNDISAWCERTGHVLLRTAKGEKDFQAFIRKGLGEATPTAFHGEGARPDAVARAAGSDKTIVVFSGDLDRALAALVIANGAAAMGRKVTLFFTFWGLNILRRPERVKVQKSLLERMFGQMMPRGSTRLGLSRLQMLGLGPRLIRWVMGKKNIASLEALLGQARMAGVRLVACQMSMDVMGIKPEELIDGVEIGGVATYLAAAEQGNVNLFI